MEAILLFGSRASGKEKPYSDTDLCVITGKNARREEILSNSSDNIDMTLFWDLPLHIRYSVINEGKPLFVKNRLAMHRITVGTVLSYLDFKPLLARYFSRFLS